MFFPPVFPKMVWISRHTHPTLPILFRDLDTCNNSTTCFAAFYNDNQFRVVYCLELVCIGSFLVLAPALVYLFHLETYLYLYLYLYLYITTLYIPFFFISVLPSLKLLSEVLGVSLQSLQGLFSPVFCFRFGFQTQSAGLQGLHTGELLTHPQCLAELSAWVFPDHVFGVRKK